MITKLLKRKRSEKWITNIPQYAVQHDIVTASCWVMIIIIYSWPKLIVYYRSTKLRRWLIWKSLQASSWFYIIEEALNNDGGSIRAPWKHRWVKTKDRHTEVYLQFGFAMLSQRVSALLWHIFPYKIHSTFWWVFPMTLIHFLITYLLQRTREFCKSTKLSNRTA